MTLGRGQFFLAPTSLLFPPLPHGSLEPFRFSLDFVHTPLHLQRLDYRLGLPKWLELTLVWSNRENSLQILLISDFMGILSWKEFLAGFQWLLGCELKTICPRMSRLKSRLIEFWFLKFKYHFPISSDLARSSKSCLRKWKVIRWCSEVEPKKTISVATDFASRKVVKILKKITILLIQ